MKKLAIIASITALTFAADAARAATASSSAAAEVVSAISIANTVGLEFGQIVPSASSGTVTVSTAGVRSTSGGVTLANGQAPSAASFAVTGAPSNTYAITLPTSITLTAAAGDPMTVDTFVSNPSDTGLLNGSGAQTLLVGATLHVAANQTANPYSGTFDVTVAYN